MGEEKLSPSGKPAPALVPVSWEDVGSDRTFRWKRWPLGPLVDNSSRRPGAQQFAPAEAALPGLEPPSPTVDGPPFVSSDGSAAAPGGHVQGKWRGQGPRKEKESAGDSSLQRPGLKAEGLGTAGGENHLNLDVDVDALAAWRQQQRPQRQAQLQQDDDDDEDNQDQGHGASPEEAEAGENNSHRNGGDDGHTGDGGGGGGSGGGTDFSFRPHTDDSITHVDVDMEADAAVGATRIGGGGEGRGGGTVGWNDSNRVRGFHDMICVGFAVSLCLNLGSLTARREGFFAAEVECLPEGAAQTVLPDLGIWVGWRQAVANDEEAVVLNLEDLSMVGAVMGILTVVGHAADALLNAVGLAVLLYGRRKPLQEAMCRLVKRLCLASLAMAAWLTGMTVIGFLVAVKGPIGAAAVDFYTDLSLYCRSSVSVSVDYAYAMTALTVLCQFFIGVVALPTPSRSSWRNRSNSRGRCCRCRRCVNPVGCCCCFLFWRARSCCCPSASSSWRPSDGDVEPTPFSATKSRGSVARTEGGIGREGAPPARFEQV